MYIDLGELHTLFDPYLFWSLEKLNIASFMRKDHLGDPNIPLEKSVKNLINLKTGYRPEGPVRMMTHLRYFGYCFNPVSFYYCFDKEDKSLETIAAEVHNTPWLEEYTYVFDDGLNEHPSKNWRRYRFEKKFHVSPFMDMKINYDWSFRVPGQRLGAHIINYTKGKKLFDATLSLEREEINENSMKKVLFRYPAMTAKVTAMIYWQALRLRLKGAPFYTHPAKSQKHIGELTT
jgi:DUF1365 family protein